MSDTAKWYVVHTYSGYENKVRETILRVVENRGLQDVIQDVQIPTERVLEKNEKGEEKEVDRKIFPGYVLVKMILSEDGNNNDNSWYIVRTTRGVTGFVGPGGKAVPLSDEEVERFGVTETQTVSEFSYSYKVGDEVRITAGAMAGFVGEVKAIDTVAGTVDVSVSMFGRETLATLDVSQVEVSADV